ncbi:MAG TPA: multiheme c-type cytochrome, partial [Kofleriaceae bacterium]
MFSRALIALTLLAACSGGDSRAREVPTPTTVAPARHAALPRPPGLYSPSFVAVTNQAPPAKDEPTTGEMLADVDSCSTCHPDVAKQWSSSAHSFASFGNPTYRESIERLRHDLGKEKSQHCGGCHDMPLMVD